MSKINEERFYQALEDVFVGANIEGDSGYVNLLKIKSAYYQKILAEFKNQVDGESIITDSFKEEFFDRLYTFFHKYFSESGSVYFAKTANNDRVYEQVYTDNKDVVLFWKTHMLYYVKSDILFQSIQVDVTDDETKQNYHFYFDVGNLEAKQNNEKRSLVFTFKEKRKESNNVDLVKGEKAQEVVVLDVTYSERGAKTKTDDLVKATQVPEHIIEKAIKTFKKQSEVDFFINKNAEKFLEEQLDIYLHQILLDDKNKFDQERLNQLRVVKTFASKIITFIAQFENELVRIWNKPKFTLGSNYVITIDKLSDEIISKIAGHKNLKEQITEWQELGMVESNFDFKKREDKHAYLPIDTKYFKDLELEILDLFDHLDDALDGRLIHSENYQALNTLKEKYREKVQCIYIDPPFNTGSDFTYVDKFQDSTWLTLMHDRISLARDFLRDDGSFYLHLDYNADHLGRSLTDKIFGSDNFVSDIIWAYGSPSGGRAAGSKLVSIHDFIFKYAKYYEKRLEVKTFLEYSEKYIKDWFKYADKDGRLYRRRMRGYDADGKSVWEKQYLDESKGVPASTVWGDIKQVYADPRAYKEDQKHLSEVINFNTQKPEKLLERILLASSNESSLIMDFFTGSATTIATAHKLGRKWIGIEMGEHFHSVDIPRMKTVLSGKISGISKDLEKEGKLKKGGFFKYESLEQYEDTLRNMKYGNSTPSMIFDDRKTFEQYVFGADEKFAHVVEAKDDDFELDFDKLYTGIDFAETISNIKGLPIKKITADSVVLSDAKGSEQTIKTDYKNMSQEEKVEFVKTLKPLLWWGE